MDDTGLVEYDRMVHAIVVAEHADEAKDIKDRARALQIYAHQAHNMEAERKAATIRIRAERRMGQLLKEQSKHIGGRPTETPKGTEGVLQPPTLSDQGITYHESSQAQQLANISDDEFEEALQVAAEMNAVPSTAGVINGTGERRELKRMVDMDHKVYELIALMRATLSLDPSVLNGVDMITKNEVRELVPQVQAAWNGVWERVK